MSDQDYPTSLAMRTANACRLLAGALEGFDGELLEILGYCDRPKPSPTKCILLAIAVRNAAKKAHAEMVAIGIQVCDDLLQDLETCSSERPEA